jgi:hypothetical protein
VESIPSSVHILSLQDVLGFCSNFSDVANIPVHFVSNSNDTINVFNSVDSFSDFYTVENLIDSSVQQSLDTNCGVYGELLKYWHQNDNPTRKIVNYISELRLHKHEPNKEELQLFLAGNLPVNGAKLEMFCFELSVYLEKTFQTPREVSKVNHNANIGENIYIFILIFACLLFVFFLYQNLSQVLMTFCPL